MELALEKGGCKNPSFFLIRAKYILSVYYVYKQIKGV